MEQEVRDSLRALLRECVLAALDGQVSVDDVLAIDRRNAALVKAATAAVLKNGGNVPTRRADTSVKVEDLVALVHDALGMGDAFRREVARRKT